MISLQKRFLFVHIPRTGGNSIQSILRNYSEDQVVSLHSHQDGIERFELRNPNFKIKKHSTLADYRAALGEDSFRSLYRFTCVRNPWDRMVSYYFRASRGVVQWDRKEFRKMVSKALSISDYLRLEPNDNNPFANVDYIMRFESLANDFQVVCAKLDVPAESLPRYNRSSRENYCKYYDSVLRELVRERFAREIEQFGYTF